MRSFLAKVRRWMQRGESGQSVILLAIGFVALVGFVGITTDVALMFVRYSQLSRAVDASAIAAANQMRSDRTQASLGIAARQFIELYGLNPTNVLVDTCNSLPINDRATDELCRADQAKLVRVIAQVQSPTVFMRLLGFQNFTLQASAVSQTAALDVVIIMDGSESMASLTTVEDWARDLDQGVIYRPPRVPEIYAAKFPATPIPPTPHPTESDFWEGTRTMPPADSLLSTWQQNVNNRLFYPGGNGNVVGADPAYTVQFDNTFFQAKYGNQNHPRVECRVRFFPQSVDNRTSLWWGGYDASGNLIPLVVPDTAATFSSSLFGQTNNLLWPVGGSKNWAGFVPTYNFYGCCNDPDGPGAPGNDGFGDLVCQPFKQARTAVLDFMDRVDFTRGDRMAIVTFDRTAFLINPYGYVVNAEPGCVAGNMAEQCRPGAMMDNEADARETLQRLVGVRAEPNFYVYTPGNIVNPNASRVTARWTGFASGLDANGQSRPVDYGKVANPTQPTLAAYQSVATNPDGRNVAPELITYPSYNSCPFSVAAAPRADRTLFDFGMNRASLPNATLDSGWGNYTDPNGKRLYSTYPTTNAEHYNVRDFSYDFYASCRGSNIGAGLREGSNALLDPNTIRQSGTVWVMILLANGGAGGSDPVRRNREVQIASSPYAWNPNPAPTGSVAGFGIPGSYGGFGLCPFGTPADPAELAKPGNDAGGFVSFPYCSDESPRSRNFCNFRPLFMDPVPSGSPIDPLPVMLRDPNSGAPCSPLGSNCRQVPAMGDTNYRFFDPTPPLWYGASGPQSAADEVAWNRDNGNLYDVDLRGCNDAARISNVTWSTRDNAFYYDADDYAHDWADYVALRRDQESDVLLPSIFTIGFGTEFVNRRISSGSPTLDITNDNNAEAICALNLNDCLGEQLLRYIADVGDNNKIDNDFYQEMLNPGRDNLGNRVAGTTSDQGSFGPRDPCQRQDQEPINGYYADAGVMYGHLAPQKNCGNYYYAPDYNQLQFVFDDIASRMFTRLSR